MLTNNKDNYSVVQAFGYAFRGLGSFFSKEKNGRVQLAIGIVTVILSFMLSISIKEWIAILLCIGLVLSLEMINSALEKLCDLVHPSFHPSVKIIKDISAGAVLWASLISAIIGLLIFLPKITIQ